MKFYRIKRSDSKEIYKRDEFGKMVEEYASQVDKAIDAYDYELDGDILKVKVCVIFQPFINGVWNLELESWDLNPFTYFLFKWVGW